MIFILALAIAAIAQRPSRPEGPPPGGGGQPPRDGRPMGGPGPDRPGMPGPGEWIKPHDTNENGVLEATEFQAAVERTFAEFDRNGDGTIEAEEIPRQPRPDGGGRPPMNPPMNGGQAPGLGGIGPRPLVGGQGPGKGVGKRILPPFFFADRVPRDGSITRAQFDQIVHGVFAEMDKNGDGMLSHEETMRMPRRPEGGPPPGAGGAPPPPNAQFIGAELRFGDKLVKGQPFSADIVIEDNRRLYDGTAVSKQSHGAVYRDGAGRTRREQPLENVGGFQVVGKNDKPQTLVFINDLAANTQIFLDLENKVARKNFIGENRNPRPDADGPPEAKTESLGTKMIEGVSAEGTRTTFEIPTGQIGNTSPIAVVSERWYSPELQLVVMSRHLDPLAGEHIFKLVNIRRSEPAADLFAVPAGFKVENPPERRPE